jgi:hypothetical protein
MIGSARTAGQNGDCVSLPDESRFEMLTHKAAAASNEDVFAHVL